MLNGMITQTLTGFLWKKDTMVIFFSLYLHVVNIYNKRINCFKDNICLKPKKNVLGNWNFLTTFLDQNKLLMTVIGLESR